MNTYDLSKVKKLLIYGMIGAVLNMIGDCLLWGVDSAGAVGAFGQYILSAQKISLHPDRTCRLLRLCGHSGFYFRILCFI